MPQPEDTGQTLVREATDADMEDILRVEEEAFGPDEGPVIAGLVRDLMGDPTAEPRLSLVATEGGAVVGHVLFTKARLSPEERSAHCSMLGPLAVAPSAQGRGVGTRLVQEGLSRMKERGVELVFVLGHPEYYPRHGFRPAAPLRFAAPQPIPPEDAEAWMVAELRPGAIASASGAVLCADALDRPEYWRE